MLPNLRPSLIPSTLSLMSCVIKTANQNRIFFSTNKKKETEQKKGVASFRFVFFFLSLALLSCTFLVPSSQPFLLFSFIIPSDPSNLVADANEVVGQLLDGVGCAAGLDGLRVVRDEDGFGGLDDDDAFSALLKESDSMG